MTTRNESWRISAWQLREELDRADNDLVILDLRYRSGQGHGHDRYLAGHVPGARFANLKEHFADPLAVGRGSFPLPAPAQLERTLRDFGIGANTSVVTYDDGTGGPAARAAWVLRWAGHSRVRVLDGGLAAWVAAGYPLTSELPSAPREGDIVVRPGVLPSVEVDTVLAAAAGHGLIDCRREAEYRAGHLPGAVPLEAGRLLDETGRLRPAAEIRAALAETGVAPDREPVVYCGGGVAAAFVVYALAEAGIRGRLYAGSWSEWSGDPSRPVEAG